MGAASQLPGAASGPDCWQIAPPQTLLPATGVEGAMPPKDTTARCGPALQAGAERRRERKAEEAEAI
eukprot:14914143-Alexandrium_andersonii.AAC.1